MHAKGKQKKREEEKVQLLLSQVLEKKLLVRLLELATKREVVIVVEGICKREILVGGMLVVCVGLDPCFGITKKSLVLSV